MIAITVHPGNVPALKSFFDRAPLASSLLAQHLGSAPRRLRSHGYIEQVFQQINQRFLEGEQLVFLLHRKNIEEEYLMPVCGFVIPCKYSWRTRVSLCDMQKIPDTDMDHYFESWLQRLCIYARRSGAARIFLETNEQMRSILKLYSGSELMRFDAGQNAYVIPLH